MTRRLRHLRRSDRGDDNMSALLTFGTLLLVAWAILQVVMVFLGRTIALEAARDGVHIGRLPPVNITAAEDRAKDYTTKVVGSWLSQVNAHGTSDGHTVTLTVTADAVSLVPFGQFTISQTASAPIEQLQP